jgi:histidine phosphotransfer protein HptB
MSKVTARTTQQRVNFHLGVSEDVDSKVNLQVMINKTTGDYPEELFDTAQLLEMKDIIGAGFAGLLQQFFEDIYAGVVTMRVACAANDTEELRRAAHKLKGSSANFGVRQVVEQCFQLEMLGKSGSVAGALAMIDELVRAHLRAKPYLDECVASSKESAA